jgi:hypothetical protein
LESDNKSGDAFEVKTEPKKRSLKLVFVAIAVIVIVIIAVLAYTFWAPHGGILGETQDEKHQWYFKGAYANYEGAATYLFMTIDFSMRLEIVDFNNTHVKTLIQSKNGVRFFRNIG